MKRFWSKTALIFYGLLAFLITGGVFWTRQSLEKYSQRWSAPLSTPQDTQSFFVPSPVEGFIIAQTPLLWEKRWSPENPLTPSDMPEAFTMARPYAEVDPFFIEIEKWELGRVISSLANSQHLDLVAKTMDYSPQSKDLRPPKDWYTKDCDLLYQEYYFRMYQIQPNQRDLVLKELTRCDARSPSRLWVLTDSLKEFSGPRAQEVLSEIKKVSLQVDLRPYKRWFAEELFKIGFLMQKS